MNKKIKRIRSDRGGEYILFNDFCVKEDIIHEVTPPYSPESNGVAERKNRTLKEMMNVMLITSKTPYELWKDYQPNLKNLRVWGCLAKVMLPYPKKSKIGSKTSDCMFLRYAEHSVAYRFLVLSSDMIEHNFIVVMKIVEFFEHIFPLKSSDIYEQPINIVSDAKSEDVRRSQRQRKETSFGDDFYTYLVGNYLISFFISY